MTNDTSTPTIRGFHAHVYFSQATLDQARALCSQAAALFDVTQGRVHERPIGPHLDWSCQLAFAPPVFGQLIPWLAMHRAGLVVFVHPISDNELIDHRDRSLWMGDIRPLNWSALNEEAGDLL